jgi:hypothetical protein
LIVAALTAITSTNGRDDIGALPEFGIPFAFD